MGATVTYASLKSDVVAPRGLPGWSAHELFTDEGGGSIPIAGHKELCPG